jgi:hypothetical protein
MEHLLKTNRRLDDAPARAEADGASKSTTQSVGEAACSTDERQHRTLLSLNRSRVEESALKPDDEPVYESMQLQTASQLADLHARRLLSWLRTDLQSAVGHAQTFLAREVEASYADMCIELDLHPRPWNSVAASFARLTRQPGRPLKTYTDCISGFGRSRRLRCYFIPAPS